MFVIKESSVDLIIKPTVACNFKCTFCSSTKLSEDPKEIVELEEIEAFIKRFPNTNTVIVNGGDPLMMPPSYYWSLIDILDRHNCPATIAFTTNLWAFYKKPELWVDLFRHPRVGVATSFQYGDKRLKGDLKPFTEAEFWACSDLMLELVGYRPTFIAVIDKDNEDSVLDTVLLAARMGVEVKLNHALASGPEVDYKGVVMGNQNKFFTQADIYRHYLAIYDAGLEEHEYNTKQMTRRLRNGATTCPLARNCDQHIRALQPGGGNYFSCGAFGDDNEYPIDFQREMSGEFFTPLESQPELFSMKDACAACPMFAICNGCKKTIADTKRLGLTEHHCRTMKSLAPRIIEANGLTGQLEPTPYEDETPVLIARG
jgi:sulfatase maturation enzyme AslB (radical SAM superfamily)